MIGRSWLVEASSKLWRAVRRWKSGVRHQVTGSGLAFTILIVLLGLAAFASANNLLFLLLASMLSTMLISGFISRLGLAGLEMKLVLPDHVFARRRLPARILLGNTKRWMPSFSIHVQSSEESEGSEVICFPLIPGGATLEASSSVFFQRRGVYGDSQYQFMTRFPFGFTERRIQVKLRREVLVYPSIDPQPGFEDLASSLEGDIDAHFRGRGHDFYRVRPYDLTDNVRHIDWKATAHTGELQVREFAREEDHLVDILLDLAVEPSQEPWLEQAIDCVAFLCWRLANRSGRVRLATQTADLRVPETTDVYGMLKFLAEAAPLRRRTAIAPYGGSSFQIVFSVRPREFLEAGWNRARVLDADAFASLGGSAGNRKQ